jgi:hypothetical protein
MRMTRLASIWIKLYAPDSTTIDLCLSLFPWAKCRRRKAAVKMHTLLDLHGNIPAFIRVTSGDVHDRRCVQRKHPGRDRDRTKTAGPGGQCLSNATDSECHALREKPPFYAPFRPPRQMPNSPKALTN